ncbi:hypothetical protein EII14_01075 [Alloprevotella sp. OH1205_COT-284]|uniref:hypothetical protein n=1 Tax=Alloprevotella sp. OH1205_COT-284 TaxID=2491043 RepID=UPI000F5DDC5B|nr:hypothetical protein [Alloprevotella sp. OH1205_COT-284]RRD80624.1 hypothetical protein EII14_01075 [Alloprevotella sp. OH1205_COT-284]
MKSKDEIIVLIRNGHLLEAEHRLKNEQPEGLSDSDRYYLMGLIFSKRSDWKNAKGCFLRAVECDNDSPAAEALSMLTDIYDFYYKDNLNP